MTALLKINKSLSVFLILLLGFTFVKAQENKKELNAGRGVIVGKESVAYKLTSPGNPVLGGEIYVELEPDDKVVAQGKLDKNGSCNFYDIKAGNYKLSYKLTKEFFDSIVKEAKLAKERRLHINFIIEGIQKGPITFGSKTGKNPLLFESPDFILEGKNNSFKVIVVTSVNNYGINDDGIK